jgi:transposase-like protein
MDKKQQIIKAYLLGKGSFRQLASQHGMGRTTIHRWVKEFCGQSSEVSKQSKAVNLPVMKKPKTDKALPADITALQKELQQERLRVKLLTTMIDIAEDELKIPIRKKYGTRQSKK